MKEKMIQKMENDNQILYEEATRMEENLNTIIKKQEAEIEKLRSYIKELKCEITEFTKKKSISTVTKTECIHTQSTYTQTYPSTNSSGTQTSEQTIRVKKNSATETKTDSRSFKTLITTKPTNEQVTSNSKILFVAGIHGKDIATLLYRKCHEKYKIQSFIKPNASDSELMKTARLNSRNYTTDDIVIIWTNECRLNLIEDFILTLTHSNILILTEPFRYDYPLRNERIHNNNLSLMKAMHFKY
ncbi:hypothetical protein JTB14_030747 [Gonioctena quinquepunctata]|nr:hypothetical protein JTB14_030747 [Gonioctena quinquepunctata]